MNISPSAATEPGSQPPVAVPSALASVLVIDDEEIVGKTLSALLTAEGFNVVAVQNGKEGVESLRGRQFEMAIADLMMPGINGLQTMAALKGVDPDIEVIILTGYATVDATIAALRQGACDFLLKPVGMKELRPAVQKALEKRRSKSALPLYEASRPLLAALNRQELIPAALKLAQRTMRATAAGLVLIPQDGARLRVHLSDDHGAFTASVAESLAEVALRAGEPLRNLSFAGAPARSDEAGIPAGSLLTYSLEARDSTVGALLVWRAQGLAPFSAFDWQQGKLLADEIVIALDNARLYRELSSQLEELKTVKGGAARTEARARAVMETAQAAVARAEARAKAIIETAQEAIVLLDREGVVRDLNPKAMEMLGRAREQAVGRSLADFAIPPRLHEGFREHLDTAFREGRDPASGCREFCALRANGEEFPIEISSAAIETPQGKLLSTFARDITERKRAERATQESEAKLQAIFDGVKTGILVIDPETHRIVDANPLALALVGASRERVLGSVCHKFVCPADKGRCPATDLGQIVDDSERVLLTASGEKLNIIKTVRTVVIGGRKLLLESFVDITARKRAEQALAEAEEHFRSLFASIPLPTFLFDAETLQYLEVNDAAVSASGYSRDELLKARVVDLVSAEIAPRAVSSIKAVGQQLERSEGRYRLKDGRFVDVESDFRALDYRGRRAVLSVSQDITARKRAESEMAERHRLATLVAELGVVLTRAENLRQGLQQCAEILVRSIGAAFARVWTVSEQEHVLELQASAGMYTHIDGGHARVPVGKFKIGGIAQSGQPHLSNSVQDDPWVGDSDWARREGMVAFAGYPLKVEDRVLGVVAAFAREPLSPTTLQALASVTDNIAQFIRRKRAEEALRESEDRYRDLVESSVLLIGTHDLQGRILNINTAAALFLEAANAEAMMGRSLSDYVPPDLLPQFDQYLKTIDREGHGEGLMVLVTPSGQRKIVEYRNTLRRRDREEPIVRWTGVDVTERIKTEEALRVSESRYRLLFQRNLAGVLRTTFAGRILECNESLARMLGYDSPAELVDAGVCHIWEDPADQARMIADLREHESLSNYEVRFRRQDGTPVWALLNIHQREAVCGEGVILESTIVDITERKQAEEKLLLTQFSIDHASDAVNWFDREGRIVYANEESSRSLGRSREELLASTIGDINPDFAPGAWHKEWERLKKAATATFEARHITKLGQTFPVEITASYQVFCGKEYLFTYGRDITQRKEAERQMDLQVTALEAAANGIVITDQKGQIQWANPAFTQLTGYSTAEVVGKDPSILKSGAQVQAFYQKLWSSVHSGEVWHGEVVNKRKDGSLYTEDMTITPVRDGAGVITHFVAIKQDVTERKQAEEKIRESSELVRLLLDSIPEAVYGIDMQGNCTFYNPACLQLLDYPETADLLGKNMHELMHHSRKDGTPYPIDECHLYEAFRRGYGTHIDDEVLWRCDGSSFPAEYWSRPIHRLGKVIGTVVTFVDITERRKAEEQTRLQTAALESAANGIAIADREGRILWVNPAFGRLTGYSADEVLGRTMRILKSGQQGPDTYRNLWQTITSGKVWQGELANRRKDGTVYTDDTTITPVRDATGTITHFVAIKQDSTERRQAAQALQERTVYLNALFEISPVGIVVLDVQGAIQMSNTMFERLFLYSREEISGATLDDLIVPPELAAEARTLTALCQGGGGAQSTSRRRRKDGSLVDTEIFGVPLVIDSELRGYMGLYQDITHRKRAEADLIKYAEDLEVSKAVQEQHAQELARLVEELAQERDLLGTVMDNLPDFIYYKDRQSRFLRTNRGLAKMLGLSDPREAVGKTDFDFFPEEDAKAYFRDEQQVVATGQPLIGQNERIREPDGQYRWYSTSTVPIRDAQGRVTGLVGITRDITERMQAEEKIRNSEAKYRSLVSNIPDVIWTMDAQLHLAFLSPNIERMSGVGVEEHYRRGGGLFLENVHPEDIGRVKERIGALFAGDEPYDVECRVRRKDGEWIWVHDRAVATYEKNGVRYADGLLTDITPRKRAEEGLRASEERYRELFENASDLVYTTDLEGRVTSLNHVGQQILGYSQEEAAQLDLWHLVDSKHWDRVNRGRQRLIAGESDIDLEVEVKSKDGRPIMLEVKPRLIYKDGKPVGVQGIGRDITGRDEAEVELRHAQKLESVGRLAAGIAHEINTPIQFVGDNTRFLQDSFGGLQTLLAKYQELRDAADSGTVSPAMVSAVRQAEEASDRAYLLEEIPKALSQTLDGVTRVATIVRAMKEFAHPEGKEMAAADLNRALLSTLTVARNELKYVADVETEFGELPLVLCNIGDLNQVFLNLLVNAAHAIGESTKGTGQKGNIRVRTIAEGSTVLVTISDTGCGIPEANRAKVFDPFFTTKEVGRGTGQGLAIARSVVVDRHKGALTFESAVGKGTTFFIRLPVDPSESCIETRTI